MSLVFGLIGVCLSGCNSTLSVAIIMISVPIHGFSYSGYCLTHFDLSLEYTGTIMGITNSIASLMGFSAPLFVGYMTKDHQTLHQWYLIFTTAIVFLTLSCVVFLIFGSAERQKWITDKEEGDALIQNEEDSL